MNPESVVVVHFEGKRVPDDRPGKKATSRTFQVVRDEVVASCNRHGKVNALGEAEFWVIDDQYNEERYQYLEVTKASAMSKKWLLDLMATLKKHEHWGVGISNIGEGYILVFPERLMVNGPTFQGAKTVDDVVERARKSLELGELIDNTKDDAGLEKLSQVTGITSKALNLRDLKKVTDVGLVHIAKLKGIKSLVLDKSAVTDAGLAHLKTLERLEDLCLQDTRITGEGFGHLECLPALKELSLASNPLNQAGIASMGRLQSLEELSIVDVPLADDWLRSLAKLGKLRKLRVVNCPISDKALIHIASLSGLEELDLTQTGITNDGMQHLEKLARLERLDLRKTKVSERGVAKLKRALPDCSVEVDPK